MNEKLLEALDEVSDRHIVQAANQKKRHTRLYLRTAAAVLAVVMLLSLPLRSSVSATELVSPAEYTPQSRPRSDDFADEDAWWAALESWKQTQQTRAQTVRELNQTLRTFCQRTNREFLTCTQNAAWSPVNAYIALGMLAQTASGTTRLELLELLGICDIEDLSRSIQILWENIYLQNDYENRTLANSLWLDDELTCRRESLEILGTAYYAGIYQTDLKSSNAESDIQTWISENTGGLLEAAPTAGSEAPIMSLLSTLLVNARWLNPFNSNRNTTGVFHSPDGDTSCTYMNQTQQSLVYSWGEDYGAVALPTMEGSVLWLILPDEGSSVRQILESGDYLNTILESPDAEDGRRGEYLVNLSLPKFRVGSDLDLKQGLQNMGLTEVFDPIGADFSETLEGDLIYAGAIRQSAIVTIDEDGIQAASVTREDLAPMAIPPDEDDVVDFILDRPFLFVLTFDGTPLFTGVVNEP